MEWTARGNCPPPLNPALGALIITSTVVRKPSEIFCLALLRGGKPLLYKFEIKSETSFLFSLTHIKVHSQAVGRVWKLMHHTLYKLV